MFAGLGPLGFLPFFGGLGGLAACAALSASARACSFCHSASNCALMSTCSSGLASRSSGSRRRRTDLLMRLLAFVKKRLKPAVGRSSPEDKPSARISCAADSVQDRLLVAARSDMERGNFAESKVPCGNRGSPR